MIKNKLSVCIFISACVFFLTVLNHNPIYSFSHGESADNGNVSISVHEIMQSIQKIKLKRYRSEAESINLIALQGEYEPVLFSVYCKNDCESLKVTMSAFEMNGDVKNMIPVESIEVKHLRMGKTLYGVHDWILEPVDDNAVGKEGLSYFWATVHVPPNAESGMYQGVLTVSLKGDETVEVPVELKVLPQKLEDPEGVHFAMLYTVSPFGQYFNPDKYEKLKPEVREFYRDLKAHGMTAISPKNSDWPYKMGRIEGLKAEVKTAMEVGLNGPVLWYMSSLINGTKGGKQYAHYDGKCDNWNEERDIANLKEIVASVKEVEKKEKWPEVFFITVDEPGTQTEDRKILNLRMDIMEKTLKTVHEFGAKGATTLTEPVDNKHNKLPFVTIPDDLRNRWDQVRPFSTIRIYGYGYPQGITNLFVEKADAEKRGHEIWFYNNEATMGKNRYEARVFYGLWGWKVGARGLTSWTYPGGRTVQWEVVREGIDDYKYLRLIQRLSQEKPIGNHARIAAEKYLKEIAFNVRLDSNGYVENWSYWKDFDFAMFRQRMAKLIGNLSK